MHPLIHLGFGLEFNQPAIVAQALAQAAVHDDWMGRDYFLPAERLAGEIGKPGQKSLLQLLNEIRNDQTLKSSVKFSDTNKFRDGVLHRAPQEILQYAAQYTVSAEQIPEKLADMINTVGEFQQEPSNIYSLQGGLLCINANTMTLPSVLYEYCATSRQGDQDRLFLHSLSQLLHLLLHAHESFIPGPEVEMPTT